MDTGRKEGGKGMKKRKRTGCAVCALILWLGISLVFGNAAVLRVYGAGGAKHTGLAVESPGSFSDGGLYRDSEFMRRMRTPGGSPAQRDEDYDGPSDL